MARSWVLLAVTQAAWTVYPVMGPTIYVIFVIDIACGLSKDHIKSSQKKIDIAVSLYMVHVQLKCK